ncbi:MAG TPA: hypothetical protein VFR66_15465 [Burkholderiales bacterium]|nr:hypothetical protein [Burkholderiales bacterium]
MALRNTGVLAFTAAVFAAACATPEVPGTYETTGERYVSVTLNPSGSAGVSTASPGRPSRTFAQGTWTLGEGGIVILTLSGPRPEQMIFQHAGDELIARDWDRTTWGQAGPGTLKRKQP